MVFTILIWETRFRHLRLLDDRLFPQIPHHAVKSLFSHRPFTVPQAYKDLCLNFSAETKIQSKVILKDTFRIIGLTLFYVYNRFCIKKDKSLTLLICVAKTKVVYLWNKWFPLKFFKDQTYLSRNDRKWFFCIICLELNAKCIKIK